MKITQNMSPSPGFGDLQGPARCSDHLLQSHLPSGREVLGEKIEQSENATKPIAHRSATKFLSRPKSPSSISSCKQWLLKGILLALVCGSTIHASGMYYTTFCT